MKSEIVELKYTDYIERKPIQNHTIESFSDRLGSLYTADLFFLSKNHNYRDPIAHVILPVFIL
jgi:hypothetical protein